METTWHSIMMPNRILIEPINDDLYVLRPMGVKETTSKPYVQINTRIDLSYSRRFGGHNIGALLLGNWYSNRAGSDTPSNSMSYSARASYDYNSRYLLELSGAYNGSDRFSKANRFDFFPSVSIGWNVAEEPCAKNFLNGLQVNLLKLRGSYGLSGADAVVGGVYTYLESYKKEYDYPFGENQRSTSKIPAYFLDKIANEDVRWEVEKKLILGIVLRCSTAVYPQHLNISITDGMIFCRSRNLFLSMPDISRVYCLI